MVIISLLLIKPCQGRAEHKQNVSYQEGNNSYVTVIKNTLAVKSQHRLCHTDSAPRFGDVGVHRGDAWTALGWDLIQQPLQMSSPDSNDGDAELQLFRDCTRCH